MVTRAIRAGSVVAGTLVFISLLFGAGVAAAHQSPPGCNSSSLNPLPPGATSVMHRNGEVVEFEAGYRNPNAGACDVTGFDVSITFPNPDGTAGGETVVVAEDRTALGGSGNVTLPPVERTVDFDDGVYSGPVTVTISGGTFHGAPVDTPYGEASATSTLYISRPHVTMDVTADPTEADAPAAVTYTYEVRNDSTSFPGDMGFVAMTDSQVTDDRCAPVTYVSGDGSVAGWLEVGETWTFTCSTTIHQVGAVVNRAEYRGSSTRDAVPDPITATAESTVTVHGVDLTVDLRHAGNFRRGGVGEYEIVATNAGDRVASAAEDITVTGSLPAGLTATALTGDGWNCVLATLTCGRAAALPAGSSLPVIELKTAVAGDAPNSVTSTATVSGGQEADESNNTDTDLAIVDPAAVDPRPAVSALKLKPARFRAASRGGPVLKGKAKPKIGTRISWKLSEKATVRFAVERKAKGKWRRLKGAFQVKGRPGGNKIRFSGRLRGKKLRPGPHRLVVIATDPAGGKSAPARKPFRILAGRKK